MEMIVLLLSSISGALIGTSVGIYLLYRKLRPITGAELDLTRGKLRSTEFSLTSATANVEKLKKLVEEREAQLAASEEKVRTLDAEATTLRQQVGDEDRLKDETKAVAETASRQLATYEAQIDADERQIKDLSAQVTRLTADLEQTRTDLREETRVRIDLSQQLTAEHDRTRQFTSRVAELEAERSHFDLTMQEERQSAAKGIELLLAAQENLTRVFRHLQPEIPTENIGHPVPVESNGHSTEESAIVAIAAAD